MNRAHHHLLGAASGLAVAPSQDCTVRLVRRSGPDLTAYVDPEGLPLVAHYRWWASRSGNVTYAYTEIWAEGKRSRLWMHILISGGTGIDHIDGNGLNNRRSNLRPASKSQNAANHASNWGASRFRGVSWVTAKGKWKAQISVSGKKSHLGYFLSEEDAAQAWNRAAVAAWGPYARLNDIDTGR